MIRIIEMLIRIVSRIFLVSMIIWGSVDMIRLVVEVGQIQHHIWQMVFNLVIIILPVMALYLMKDEPLFGEEEKGE